MAAVVGMTARSEGRDDRRIRNKHRLSTAGWGLLLVWTGALILVPGDLEILWHTWLLGAGAIVLGAAVVALRLGIKPAWDSWILGLVGVASGLAGLLGASISVIGLGMLMFGLAFLVAVVRASFSGTAAPPTAT